MQIRKTRNLASCVRTGYLILLSFLIPLQQYLVSDLRMYQPVSAYVCVYFVTISSAWAHGTGSQPERVLHFTTEDIQRGISYCLRFCVNFERNCQHQIYRTIYECSSTYQQVDYRKYREKNNKKKQKKNGNPKKTTTKTRKPQFAAIILNFEGGTSFVVPYLFLLSVFILWFGYYVSNIF